MKFSTRFDDSFKQCKIVAVFALIIGCFFSIELGNRRFATPDEGRYVEIAREMAESGDYVTPRLNGVKYFEKPPLFYWMEAASIKLGGIDFFRSRLVEMLLGVFGCLALMTAALNTYGLRTAVTSGCVLATTLLYYVQSRFISLDLSLSVFMSAALLCYFCAIVKPCGIDRRRLIFWFYVFSALAILAKGLVGIILPGLVIFTWLIVSRMKLNEIWNVIKQSITIPGSCIFFVIAAPWHILCAMKNPEFPYFYFIHEHFIRYTTTEHCRYQPIWFFVPILLAALLPWTGICSVAIKKAFDERKSRDSVFLLCWIFSIFVFFSISNSKLIPYILPIFPPIALLTGRLLSDYVNGDNKAEKHVNIGFSVSMFIAACAAIGGWFYRDLIAGALNSASITLLLVLGLVFAVLLILWTSAKLLLKDDGYCRNFRVGIFVLAAANMMILVNRIAVFYQDDRKPSTYEIAQSIKYNLKPGVEVFAYYVYFQDLPAFLGQTIGVIDHIGEFEFGLKQEDHTNRFMSSEQFLEKFKTAENRIFVCIRREDYNRFFEFFKCSYKIFDVNKDFVLIVNK